ncbi:SusC/RagA family TonB-linked outer membrane protein [Parapedobacter indicus]|uniref:TonB-linked outer membrane protein, SusC/RagA family n=1 Tax=Parapedobacter indicus TaxID=1477437 RepID=A0A1I3Q0Q9_9SPHI|nr:TonB-dependent receptor [Parapedobacter indicus]PPL00616.1 TonB-linked SusC/RagA family outer membrane protein [Parapedobacter indicus]SFJ26736.1 TonB-linked outer membrane protein, SusC/RagA family [Parapedobacter indicus]
MNRLLVGKWYVRIALLYLIIFVNGAWLHALATSNTLQQTGRIVGRVTDVQGAPLSGASVRIAGEQRSVATDDEGRFSLTVTPGEHIVEVSYISYGTQQQTVAVREGASVDVNFVLTEEAGALSEVVVVGYGTQRKVNLTGAVDQVTSEVFENRPIPNISQGLVGAVPNLNIKMYDGKPTQSPAFNVRGTTSIGQGGSALILIDGVEGDPRMLNPNDIESISILKDASSASIYGARAAFGVVLITTKSAAAGKTSITYSTNLSSKSPTTVPDNITDSYPWAQGFSDAWSRWNDNGNTPTAVNKTLPFSPAYLAEIKRRWEDPSLPRVEVNPSTGEYQYYYSTDWYHELYKERFFAQDHNLALSGGNDKAAFYVSGRYNGQDGLFRYNTDTYSMYNLRAKGTIQLTPWLQLENNTEYSRMEYHQPLNVGEGSGIWRNMADEGHPLAPLLNPDGTLSFPAAYTVGDYYIGRNGTDEGRRFLKNRTAAKAEFFDKSLTLRGDFTFQSMDIGSQQNRVQVPYSRYEGVIGYTGTNTNDLQEFRRTTDYLATNVYADYVKSFNDAHNLSLLAGFNYEQSLEKSLTARRNGIVYADADDINLALGQSIVTSGGNKKWAIAGGFFRVNYNFKERYLLEVNGRYDGSSKFPTDQQWAFFPSASIGWRISEEPFWNVNSAAFSNVKFRASYGSLGNGNIDPYSFTENFAISQSGRIINGVRPQRTGQPGVIPAGLTWETSTTGNLGLEFSSLNNRLQFVGDLYRRWTSNMFTVGPTLPAIYGTTVPKGNYADLETTGWEVSVTWRDQFAMAEKPFTYDIRVTMADYRAIITKYNNKDRLLTDHYAGKRVGEIWGYQVEGLFQSEEEIANSPSQANVPNTNTRKNYVGDLKFKNLDGDDIIYQGANQVGDSGDKSIIGNSEPRYTYGFNLNGDWNGFFLSAFFQGVLKQDYYPSPEARFWGQYNRPYNQYPRWQADNMFRPELGNFDAYLPRLVGYIAQGTGRALNVPNDRYLQNAAYIRLRNLQVGYSLPKKLISKLHANDLRLYVSAENLWTWSPMYKWTKDTDVTNIYGSDRDLSGGSSGDGYNYPMLKTISVGLTVNF